MKNVAIYCRVSTLEQAETGYSLQGQEDQLRSYCKSLNYNVAKVYSDGGFSGANMNRPALTNMINDIKAGVIGLVVVFKLDRLSRSQKDTLHIIESLLLPNNCDLVSISESFDTSTAFGRALVGILSVFAQLERENIKERMALGKREATKSGKWMNGTPFAYDRVDGDLIPNDNAAKIKLAYEMYLSGYGIPSISKKFPDISRGRVRSWLLSPVYAGKVKYNDILEDGLHEPIVSWDDFCKVQDMLAGKKQVHGLPASQNALAGLCRCKYCGGLMTRRYTWGRNKAYKAEYLVCYSRSKTCRSMIMDENCIGKYWRYDTLFGLLEKEVLELTYNENEFNKNNAKEIEVIDYSKDLSKLEVKIIKLTDLYLEDHLDKNSYLEKKQKLENELVALKRLISKNDDSTKKIENIQATIMTLKDGWQTMDNIQKNQTLKLLINEIVVDNESMQIKWRF